MKKWKLLCVIQVIMFLGFFSCCCYSNRLDDIKIPEYCANTIGSNRDIPPLSDIDLSIVTRLKQVQILLRHGARIPYASFQCWKDYNVSWTDCKVHVLESPSTNRHIPALFQFRKVYDGSVNSIPGTCQVGYEQAQQIGLKFQKHYVGPGSFHIFSSNKWEEIDDSALYLQSDDEERTLLTGQSFVTAFFNTSKAVVVNWHTGDDISPLVSCPLLAELAQDAYLSDWFQRYNSTVGERILFQANKAFGDGYWSFRTIFDCIMTTICSNRRIPGTTQQLFDDLVNYTEEVSAYTYLYNRSKYAHHYSKDILTSMSMRLRSMMENDSAAFKFTLRGMHDSDISAALSILLGQSWNRKWPPYASVLVVELFEGVLNGAETLDKGNTKGKQYFVRVVYNGNTLRLKCRICNGDQCSSFCSAEDFLKLIYIPPSVHTDCALFRGSRSTEIPFTQSELNKMASNNFVIFLHIAIGASLSYFISLLIEKHRNRRFKQVEYSGISMTEIGYTEP